MNISSVLSYTTQIALKGSDVWVAYNVSLAKELQTFAQIAVEEGIKRVVFAVRMDDQDGLVENTLEAHKAIFDVTTSLFKNNGVLFTLLKYRAGDVASRAEALQPYRIFSDESFLPLYAPASDSKVSSDDVFRVKQKQISF